MKLKYLGANMTLLTFTNGNELFFSYETPVAGRNSDGLFRTDKYFSTTTSRHINQWLNGDDARVVPQSAIDMYAEFDELLSACPQGGE